MTLEVRIVITLDNYSLGRGTRNPGMLQPPTVGSPGVFHHLSLVSLDSTHTFETSLFIQLSPIILRESVISGMAPTYKSSPFPTLPCH